MPTPSPFALQPIRRRTATTATAVVFSAATLLLDASALAQDAEPGASAAASAQDAETEEGTSSQAVSCLASKNVYVVGTGNTVCRPISTAWTHIVLPENAEVRSQRNPPGFTIRDSKGLIEIVAHSGAPPGTETAIKISVPGQYIATFIARAVTTPSQALGQYTVSHLTEAQAFAIAKAETRAKHLAAHRARDQARIQELERQSADHKQERDDTRGRIQDLDRRVEKRARQAAKANRRAEAAEDRAEGAERKALNLETELGETKAQSVRQAEEAKRQAAESEKKTNKAIQTAKDETWASASEEMREGKARRVREEAVDRTAVRFHPIYDNAQPRDDAFTLESSAWDSEGVVFFARFKIEPDGLSHPKPAKITKVFVHYSNELPPLEVRLYDLSKTSKKPGIMAILRPGDELTGAIAIPEDLADFIQGAPHRIEFQTTDSDSFLAHLRGWRSELISIDVEPLTGAERWARTTRENEQIIIAPRVVAGGFWVPNGLVGDARRLEPTWFAGGGVRLTKGFRESFAFEADLVGGRTGVASFEQVSRQGHFARLLAGAALRFGHDTIPIFRVGVGLLGAFYDETPESGESSEYTGLLVFGFGYAKRYSEQWVLSASAAAVLQGADELRTFEFGLQIGYGFTPGYTPK